jgi:glutamyl-tRNA synthetase
MISRIAPTPSGYLHLGNACNFILTWLLVRRNKGSLRLRIDDSDAPRMREEYLEDIFINLDWLGLDWDEGPRSVEEHQQKYAQQRRFEEYEKVILGLKERGHTYVCRCSREQRALVNGHCANNCKAQHYPDDHKTALHLLTPEEVIVSFHDEMLGNQRMLLNTTIPDFVIRRKDGIPAYQVTSYFDDLIFGVDTIVRGIDLLPSTSAQLFIATELEEKRFEKIRFYHHPLIKDKEGNKLSKSAGGHSLKELREGNPRPDLVFRFFCDWMGWKTDCGSAEEILDFVFENPVL